MSAARADRKHHRKGGGLAHALLAGAAALPWAGALAQSEPFLDDAKAGAQLRAYYFDRDLPANVTQQSTAIGGWLWGRTGYWRDFLQFGGTFYTSLPLADPKNKEGAGLLKPGQNGYGVLGEAYARLKYGEQTGTFYRQLIGSNPQTPLVRSLATDSSYLAPHDIRMSPYTYEAAMFNGNITDTLRYQAGYVDSVKNQNAEHFVSMSSFAGVTTKNTGMWTGGMQWQPKKDLWVQGFYYSVPDTIRIAYTDVDWVNWISKDSHYRFASQYTDQRSDGANLLTGHSFSTWNGAVYGEYGWNWLTLYAAYSTTGNGQQIRNPYSDGPLYVTRRIKTFGRAGEDAVLLGSTFSLAPLGLNGLSFDMNVTADTNHPPNTPTGAFQPKWREYDTDLVYRFSKDFVMPNTRIRLRWATVGEDYGTRTDRTNDLRFDLNWAVNFN